MINPKQLLCDHWGVIISASNASTISRHIAYLTLKSQQYIDDMAKKTLPFMYKKSIEGINEVLKECWHINLQKDIVPPLFHSISLLFRDIKFIYRFRMRSVRHGDIFVLPGLQVENDSTISANPYI